MILNYYTIELCALLRNYVHYCALCMCIGYVSLFHDLHFISLSIIILLLFTPEMIVIILFRVELLFIESAYNKTCAIWFALLFGEQDFLAILKRSAHSVRQK